MARWPARCRADASKRSDLIARVASGELATRLPQVTTYGASADEAERFGLPCGGTVQVVLEPLSSQSRLRELLAAIEAHWRVARRLDMTTGLVQLDDALEGDTLRFDGAVLATVHGPRLRLLIIGGGQPSRYLPAMAVMLDYRVTVCEPREEYHEGWQGGSFREDLFYRLNVSRIDLPPLRERREDIAPLASHCISRFNRKHRLRVRGIAPDALGMLVGYDWPGNVRELENVLERCVILSGKGRIEKEVLPPELHAAGDAGRAGESKEYSLKKMSRIMEEQLMRKALVRTRGNRTHAAQAPGDQPSRSAEQDEGI